MVHSASVALSKLPLKVASTERAAIVPPGTERIAAALPAAGNLATALTASLTAPLLPTEEPVQLPALWAAPTPAPLTVPNKPQFPVRPASCLCSCSHLAFKCILYLDVAQQCILILRKLSMHCNHFHSTRIFFF